MQRFSVWLTFLFLIMSVYVVGDWGVVRAMGYLWRSKDNFILSDVMWVPRVELWSVGH